MTKTQRQHRIAKLLAEQPVTSQTHLVDLLAERGGIGDVAGQAGSSTSRRYCSRSQGTYPLTS